MRTTTAERDLRIDFCRGFALFSIFVAHVPFNSWSVLLLRNYSPSDSADIFVFCSGFASALAFGAVFDRSGFAAGSARVLYRCWQIYWAQIGMFLVGAGLCVLATHWLGTKDYLDELNVRPFFDQTGPALVGLLTLTYVPNYFDMLPMYLVMLLMIPAAMLLRRLGIVPLAAASLLLWALPKLMPFNLPAEWWSDRGWFFNPFVWQLLFMTAFALGRGWIRPPPASRWLISLAAAYVLVMVPLASRFDIGWIWDLRDASWAWGWQKSQFGLVRFLYILALAYLVHCGFGAHDRLFQQAWTRPLITVGQQALPVFTTSIVLSMVGGMLLDKIGRGPLNDLAINLAGFAALFATARIAGYYQHPPWRRRPAASVAAQASESAGTAVPERPRQPLPSSI